MRLLVKNDLNAISGGLTCEQALIREIEDFDFDFVPAEYCTKAQFTKYGLAMIDKFYEPNGWESLTEQTAIDFIKSLNL
ncbi:hypothetical protein [Candidatus Berkiella aquae]|uniref:Uncharacterized protein n=1 Tax=Candidatus Berkiella aquae TaxID=295108 RepID=A0A0Q9Z0T2_9GAMM|nr:hypothetical protein [Candidatus Berkiella aquae]MCS5711972.1 hypothetical protein [Candidatus Berkiella aquae]